MLQVILIIYIITLSGENLHILYDNVLYLLYISSRIKLVELLFVVIGKGIKIC